MLLTYKKSSCYLGWIHKKFVCSQNELWLLMRALYHLDRLKENINHSLHFGMKEFREKKEQIVSAFHAFFLAHRDEKRFVIWLDNCAGQNKTWCFFSFLIYLINSEEVETVSIELNYFESGHTFMAADSFHHRVEEFMKTMGKIYDFQDF